MAGINRSAAQLLATIVGNTKVGQYHQILISVGELVSQCKPGNFVAISVGGPNSRMVLRRAFAISRTTTSPQYGGAIELIVAPFGNGSSWLCGLAEGEQIDITLPLGTAFGIPTTSVNALLVGGGYGSAPLFGLAEVLKERGCRVDMLLGASTGSKIYAPLEGKRSVNSLRIFTEDGSMGETGRITAPIAQLVSELQIDVIYSCGPMAMLKAISEILDGGDVVHQCAVEEAMACGIGICMTCVLPVKDETGKISNLRSCIDGPVMDGAAIEWDLVGKTLVL
jgi:dihydroorotate dehydrogenase electron transfer subunit|uniref:dihydroorotate dehydrogenase electron transfer subunit n=1 Tax=Candidatus Planktophila sp. TaxID=2175601 RepID=UPI00404A73BE